MSLKKGANVQEQAAIKRYFYAGAKADEISEHLGIELSCIESFVSFFKEKKREEDKAAKLKEKEAEANKLAHEEKLKKEAAAEREKLKAELRAEIEAEKKKR